MSFLDVTFRRRSIRCYKSESVPDEVLNNVLEAGRLAPSAGNRQSWHFIVITDPKIKRELSKGTWRSFIEDSAFTIVGCGEKRDKWSTVDVAIALENMVLAGEAQGVGSCWIGAFEEEDVKELFGIPDDPKGSCLSFVRLPSGKTSPHGKKSLKEIVHYNKF